jgi:hypothetical protein
MSLKSLLKTRWKIETDRVTIYPYGLFYIFSAVMAIFSGGLLIIYTQYQNTTVAESLPLVLLILLIVVLFWGSALTYIEFDNSKGRMRKILLGFIPTVTIPLADLQGIDVVSGMTTGSYNYNLFRKDSRFGRGIVVSSAYTKNDDPNAVAFVEEAVPIIHSYLDKYDSAADFVQEPLTAYKYFEPKGNSYVIKSRKAGSFIFGLLFFGIGIWLFTIPADSLIAILFCIALFFLFGLVFINAAFTNFVFDPQARTVKRTGLFRFLNKQYDFNNFRGIQTVRHTMNFIYVRTSINLNFEVTGKNEILTVASLFRSKSVDRFIRELYQIMDVR